MTGAVTGAVTGSILRVLHGLLVAALAAFLLAPVLLVFPMSLSADADLSWPPSGWSLRWYAALLADDAMIAALGNSLLLAAAVTALALLIAFPAALALARGRLAALAVLLTLPLLLPSIVLGLALLVLFVRLGLVGSWPGMAVAHLLITLPYALRVLETALRALPPGVEEAAASLGARPAAVALRITLPLAAPGLAAAAILVFLVSFDEVVVSLFVAGPRLTTLPVALYRHVESRSDPLVAAVAALLVLGTLALVIALERLVGLRRALGEKAEGGKAEEDGP